MKKALEKVHVVAEGKEGEAVVSGKARRRRMLVEMHGMLAEKRHIQQWWLIHCAPRNQLAWFLQKDVQMTNPSTNGIMRLQSTVHLFATFPFSAAVSGFFLMKFSYHFDLQPSCDTHSLL